MQHILSKSSLLLLILSTFWSLLQAQQSPNVLILFTDDHSNTAVGGLGNKDAANNIFMGGCISRPKVAMNTPNCTSLIPVGNMRC